MTVVDKNINALQNCNNCCSKQEKIRQSTWSNGSETCPKLRHVHRTPRKSSKISLIVAKSSLKFQNTLRNIPKRDQKLQNTKNRIARSATLQNMMIFEKLCSRAQENVRNRWFSWESWYSHAKNANACEATVKKRTQNFVMSTKIFKKVIGKGKNRCRIITEKHAFVAPLRGWLIVIMWTFLFILTKKAPPPFFFSAVFCPNNWGTKSWGL